MLSVTIGTNRRVLHSGFDRNAVNALLVGLCNLFVALRAGLRHAPVIYSRFRLSRRLNVVIPVTIIAICRLTASRSNRAAVYALLVGLHGMRDGNLMA